MTNYNAFLGGNENKWPMQSTLDSGITNPHVRLRYAVTAPRAFYALPFWFDGGNEQWGVFMLRTTTGGQGFRVGDSIAAVAADAEHLFLGLSVRLKKALPSGIGLIVTVAPRDAAYAEKVGDPFTTKTITIPAGSAAGSAWKAPASSGGDYSTTGTYTTVQFTGADGLEVGTLLNVQDVCFSLKTLVVDLSDDRECSCPPINCPASYPDPTCGPNVPVDVSNFTPGGVSAAPTSGGSGGTSSGGTSSGGSTVDSGGSAGTTPDAVSSGGTATKTK